MADQIEEIRLKITPGSTDAVDQANASLDSIEKKSAKVLDSASENATKAVEKVSAAAITISDRSKSTIQRFVESRERQAALAGKDRVGQLEALQQIDVKRAGNNPEFIERINNAYRTQIEIAKKLSEQDVGAQKAKEAQRAIDSAVSSSERAATATDKFNNALSRVNKTAADGLAIIERRAALAGADKFGRLEIQRQDDLSNFGNSAAAAERINRANAAQVKALQAEDARAVKERRDKEAGELAANITAIQKRAALGSGGDKFQQLEVNRIFDLDRFGKSEEAIKKINNAYRDQAKALREVEAAKAKSDHDTGLGNLERKAAFSGASPIQRLALQEADDLKKFGNSAENIDRVRNSYAQLRATVDDQPTFFKQIVDAGIFVGILEKVLSGLKAVTVDAALYAARTDQLGVALGAVANAGKISTVSLQQAEKGIEKLGVTTQDTRANLARLVGSQVEYTKGIELARIAQNLGRISGEGTAAAFERITNAIVTGQPELLKHLGLNVNLEAEYNKVAGAQSRSVDSLTALEKVGIRTNLVISAGANYNGVYAASLNTVSGRLLSLTREFLEAKNAVGGEFQKEAGATLLVMEKLAEAFRAFPTVGADLIRILGVVGGALAFIFGGTVVAGIGLVTVAVAGLSFAVGSLSRFVDGLVDNYIFLSGKIRDSDFLTAASQKFNEIAYQDFLKQENGRANAVIRANQITEATRKKVIEAERQSAGERDQARSLEIGGIRAVNLERERSIREKSTFIDDKGQVQDAKLTATTLANINATAQAKIAIEVRKTEEQIRKEHEKTLDLIQDNEKVNIQSRSDLQDLTNENFFAKDIIGKRNLEDLTYELHRETISRIFAADVANINAQTARDIAHTREEEARKGTLASKVAKLVGEKQAQADEAIAQSRRKSEDALEKERIQIQNARDARDRVSAKQREDYEAETQQRIFAIQRSNLERSKEYQLEQLNLVSDQSLQAKLRLEAAKFAIERDALARIAALEIAALDARHNRELAKIKDANLKAGLSDEESLKVVQQNNERYQIERAQIAKDANAQIAIAASRTANRQAQEVLDYYKSTYDSIKSSASGVFDEIFTKSKNIFQAAGDVLKTAMLTALKEVVTSNVAAAFTKLVTGASVTFAQGGLPGQDNAFSKLAQALGIGSTPVFNGGKVPKIEQPNHIGDARLGGGPATAVNSVFIPGSGANPIISQPTFGAGVPGGVGTVVGTPPYLGGGAAGASQGAAGQVAGAAGIFGGLKTSVGGFLTQLGQIGATSKIFQNGIYGAKGGGLLLGGGILAADGLRRGGLLGLGETTAGGALIGAKFGGPVGALIGAGIGFAAGSIRLLFKGAQTKLIEKVKSQYGIDIDKDTANQIMSIVKSNFGGDLNVALASPQIRDMLELYAMMHGQKFSGGYAKQQATSLVQSGGAVFQSPNFFNGSQLPDLGGEIPTLGLSGAAQQQQAATNQPYAINIKATDDQISDFLTTKTLSIARENPGVISKATTAGYSNNSGRRESTALAFEPGTVMS